MLEAFLKPLAHLTIFPVESKALGDAHQSCGTFLLEGFTAQDQVGPGSSVGGPQIVCGSFHLVELSFLK